MRVLNLSSWDPTHYTTPILQRLAVLPSDSIPNVDLIGLVQISTIYAQSWSPNPSDYFKFLISAYHLAINTGLPIDGVPFEIQSLSAIRPDEQSYTHLVDELKHALYWLKPTP